VLFPKDLKSSHRAALLFHIDWRGVATVGTRMMRNELMETVTRKLKPATEGATFNRQIALD